MFIIKNHNNRSKILELESYEEYLLKIEKINKEALEERKKIEKRHICDGCGVKNKNLRWIYSNEFYVCYKCFIEGLENDASVSVPMMRVEEMRDYITEDQWDELEDLLETINNQSKEIIKINIDRSELLEL